LCTIWLPHHHYWCLLAPEASGRRSPFIPLLYLCPSFQFKRTPFSTTFSFFHQRSIPALPKLLLFCLPHAKVVRTFPLCFAIVTPSPPDSLKFLFRQWIRLFCSFSYTPRMVSQVSHGAPLSIVLGRNLGRWGAFFFGPTGPGRRFRHCFSPRGTTFADAAGVPVFFQFAAPPVKRRRCPLLFLPRSIVPLSRSPILTKGRFKGLVFFFLDSPFPRDSLLR